MQCQLGVDVHDTFLHKVCQLLNIIFNMNVKELRVCEIRMGIKAQYFYICHDAHMNVFYVCQPTCKSKEY